MRNQILTSAAALLLLTSSAVAQVASKPSAETRYDDAWYLLEVERKPKEALLQFEAIAARAETTRVARAKCFLSIAKCHELLGKKDAANAKLREALEQFGDLPFVAQEASARLSSSSTARWLCGIQKLHAGQYLDLDTGGVFSESRTPSGVNSEINCRMSAVLDFSGNAVDDAAIVTAVPWLSNAPWKQLTTDLGHTAWFQVLTLAPVPTVRFITRISGGGPVLPTPKNLCCVGKGDAIEVWFDTDKIYQKYRIERRDSPDGIFINTGTIDQPPFIDRGAGVDARIGYRVTGITTAGDEGISQIVQGTVKSAGCFSGTTKIKFTRDRQMYDLLKEEFVPSGGDISLANLYGNYSSAGFVDSKNQKPYYYSATSANAAARSPYEFEIDADAERFSYVGPEAPFIILLNGGGIARCSWRPGDEKTSEIELEYTVYPDADSFPQGPTLLIVDDQKRVTISVTSPYLTKTEEVAVKSLVDAEPDAVLKITNGEAIHESPSSNIYQYRAIYTDRHGRTSPPAVVLYKRLSRGIREGTFEIKYLGGFSFAKNANVPAAEADIVLRSLAGGASSVGFTAARGILNLRNAVNRRGKGDETVTDYYQILTAVDPESLKLGSRADGDSNQPATDVFVVKTRDGGFAKLMIEGRDTKASGWTEYKIQCRYCYNPFEPVFTDGSAASPSGFTIVNGLKLNNTSRNHIAESKNFGFEEGELTIKKGTGWSFTDMAVVKKNHDLLYSTATSAAEARIEVRAGLLKVTRAVPENLYKNKTGMELYKMIEGVDPKECKLTLLDDASATANAPENVFVGKTRDGGWFKFAVVGVAGGEEPSITIRYYLNYRFPTFGANADQSVNAGGILMKK